MLLLKCRIYFTLKLEFYILHITEILIRDKVDMEYSTQILIIHSSVIRLLRTGDQVVVYVTPSNLIQSKMYLNREDHQTPYDCDC